MENGLKKLEELLPKNKIGRAVFTVYKKKAGKNIKHITSRVFQIYEKKECKIERAMADALFEHFTGDKHE